MKTVFTNRQCVHVWAQQSQSEGRSGNRNIFFHDRTIYSYGHHFPMAMFVKNTRGEEAVLITGEKYSSTTAGHVSAVWSAVRHKNCIGVFSLRMLMQVIPDNGRVNSKIGVEVLKAYAADFEKFWQKALRSQAYNRAWYFDTDLPKKIADAQKVADFFRCKNPVKMPDLTKHREHLAKLIATADERAEKRRQRIKAQMEGHLERWRTNAEYPLPKDATEFMTEDDRAVLRTRELAKYALEIAEWREGKRHYLGYSGYGIGRQYLLRLAANGTEIETSGGARFPVDHGKKAFELIRQCHDRGEGYKRNGHSIHLGTFVIDEITAEGHVKAGCHYVTWDEIEAMAKKLEIA